MALKISSKYKDIAEKIVDKYDVAFGHIELDSILFLEEDSKSPKEYASVQLVKSPYTFITNYKFILTVYQPKVIAMTDAQLHLLILHELMHINDNFDGLVKHDINDFAFIVEKFGCYWDTDPNIIDVLEEEIDFEQ